MLQDLQIFGFRALWSPYYALFILTLALAYLIIFINRKDSKRVNVEQVLYFYGGLVLLYIIKGSPMDLMSHIMFTAHMLQMALYYLLFPILIIKGIPTWAWRKVFEVPVLKHVLKLLTKPLIALLLFNGLFSLYHIPIVFDFAKANEWHIVVFLLLF
ncbi:CtaG protein [Gracilibacillus boraciitolerans JCM 21714]|uniref:CtaG protein n=1 Tax=Gracilibacillus boraciitolerans JCM 21714 TaxID=1298598 RepID=W4VED8_9BACI|nr:CtaG protein [Gracilibacillus boraciitolerans JCM 21714]